MFSNSDIICFQETWYGRQDLSYLNALDSDFHGTGASTRDYENRLVAGHPPGGVAILWHRKLEQYVKPVELGLDWCAAIEVSVGHRRFYIINVYMLYQCPENEEKYLDSLGAIHAIVSELDSTCYAIMGDWNANLSNTANSVFAQHMINFCSDNDLVMSSIVSSCQPTVIPLLVRAGAQHHG